MRGFVAPGEVLTVEPTSFTKLGLCDHRRQDQGCRQTEVQLDHHVYPCPLPQSRFAGHMDAMA